MRRDHLDTVGAQLCVQIVAVVRVIPDQIVRHCFKHVEIKSQLQERDLMLTRSVRGDGERLSAAVHDCHDCQVIPECCRTNFVAAALCRCERSINIALGFGDRTLLSRRIRQIGAGRAHDFVLAPLLKTPVHWFVVRIRLREHVPLRAAIKIPQHRLKNLARWGRLVAWTIVGNMFFEKMRPNQFPLLVS